MITQGYLERLKALKKESGIHFASLGIGSDSVEIKLSGMIPIPMGRWGRNYENVARVMVEVYNNLEQFSAEDAEVATDEDCEHLHIDDSAGGDVVCLDCGKVGYIEWE